MGLKAKWNAPDVIEQIVIITIITLKLCNEHPEMENAPMWARSEGCGGDAAKAVH